VNFSFPATQMRVSITVLELCYSSHSEYSYILLQVHEERNERSFTVDMAPAVKYSPSAVLPNFICINMDVAEGVEEPIAKRAWTLREVANNRTFRGDWKWWFFIGGISQFGRFNHICTCKWWNKW
jgi:hypothetical protein